ncbi:MAG: MFS transporter [Methylococcales bacterium]|nr:MFS transporter [Methylococcales bacterium]
MSVPARRLSAFYFCYFAILGAFLPFWSLYLRQTGFNAEEIGELTALLVATKIIAPNLWGWLADKTGRRLRLIRLTSLFSTLFFAGFLYKQDLTWFAVITIAFSFFWNASLPQFEAATLFHLKTESHRYSRIRLWGSVGFIAAVLGIGRFLDTFSIRYLPDIILSILLLNWLVALIIPEVQAQKTQRAATAVWRILADREVLAFFAVYLLLQVAHGPYYVFYSVYLAQHGYSPGSTSFLWALGVCAEILMFLGIGRLLKLFSPRALLLGSLALSSMRWFLIAYQADSLPVMVAAQLLHAATFGVAHVVAIQLLFKYFGSQHQGKGQAFYSSLSFGVGGMLGSLYSGYFWDSLGGSLVFVIAAIASGLAWVIAFLGVGRKKAH